MGRVLAAIVLIFAAADAFPLERVVHSRADLLQGTALDRFFDFGGNGQGWRGVGRFEGGVLHLEAPFVGDWGRAFFHWEGADPFAIEWEARPAGGPLDAELALLVACEPGASEVRVRFSPDGRVSVDRMRGGWFETIAPAVSQSVQRGSGWGSYAVRVSRRVLSVVLAGEEVLTAELPESSGSAIGFAVSPGGVFEIDHVALHRSRRGMPPRAASTGERPVFFDSFSIGRDEWTRSLFPAREGALAVSGSAEETLEDFLTFPLPDACRVRVVFRVEGTGPAAFLFHTPEEGEPPRGYACAFDPDGSFALYRKESPADRLLETSPKNPHFRFGRWNTLDYWSGGGAVRVHLNGEPLFERAVDPSPPGRFGISVGPGGGLAVDEIVIFDAAEPAPFDTATAAAIWRDIASLAEQRALATKSDRLRDLFLLAPSLPGVLDLLFRDAARAGDAETALTAANALVGKATPGSDEEKLRLIALLLLRRWEDAHGELARFRAIRPDDPFGLENTLLLLDRTGEHERLIREHRAAVAAVEPLRAVGHGAAAWAYLRSRMTDRAFEALRVASRLGPGRIDLSLVEGDLLRAQGDLAGASARYEAVLASGLAPVPEANVRARMALVRFERGEYRAAADALAALPETEDPRTRRARGLLEAFALYQSGRAADAEGRPELERAEKIVAGMIPDPPAQGDGILLDLLGRVRAALALLDFREGESYPAYREKTRRAMDLFAQAARLDPTFVVPSPDAETIPDFDPTRFRTLLQHAYKDDHPMGGFIESLSRWTAWSVADRRADLAEREIGLLLQKR
ncbi:MAG: hypothetical protein FJY73_05280 [Candidatus Eisenbacteria bacterium]|nr:hypothetical protein [Candidatus Eisenbacteria bacterium]